MTERPRALRRRQARKSAKAFARLDASEPPPEPTVEAIAEHVRCAGSRRDICLEVPRTRRPTGKRITLLSRSGPRSVKDRPITWDPERRAVTAYWAVEDLREWVEYAGGGGVGADMAKITTSQNPEQFKVTVTAKGGKATISTLEISVESLADLGRVFGAIKGAVEEVKADLAGEDGEDGEETAGGAL